MSRRGKQLCSGATKVDGNSFVKWPMALRKTEAFRSLTMTARALLLEIASQYRGDNNGSLLCSAREMSKYGFRSDSMLHKAKMELIDKGFIFETVKGRRPNRASWYAVTWMILDKLDGFDEGAEAGFAAVRSAYQRWTPPPELAICKPARGHETRLRKKAEARAAGDCKKRDALSARRSESVEIAPPSGAGAVYPTPSHGAMRHGLPRLSTPPRGDHLEMPSDAAFHVGDSVPVMPAGEDA